MEKQTKNNGGFIPLERINFTTARTRFKYKRNHLKIVGAFGLMSISFIIPDASAGLVVGLMMLSPLKLKDSLRNKYEDVKHFLNKRLVLWGVK